MAVCNLFNSLNKQSGNFLLFSQYVEDVTRSTVEGDNYKVVPSKFIALDIDYSQNNIITANGSYALNEGLPKYFQNYYENSCAYFKNKEDFEWNAHHAKYLFWNSMKNGNLISVENFYNSNTTKFVPEIVYFGDINMHSYSEHKGMGYNEVYCYIPTNAERMRCQIIEVDDTSDGKLYESNSKNNLEGYTDKFIGNYSRNYYYTEDYKFSFEDDSIANLSNASDSNYNINTIVVLYSILVKNGDEWVERYSNIPMGMYIAGKFDENNKLTNIITKYVSTNYDTGTSYGLRICTRFAASEHGVIMSNYDITSDSSYSNVCQLMTAMNENLSKMLDISKSAINTTQYYKETLSSIKNNRTNVPYVKQVNGKECWFVNGRLVGVIDQGQQLSCVTISEETIKKRLENLSDENPDNDFTYIYEPNECKCEEVTMEELLEIFPVNNTTTE